MLPELGYSYWCNKCGQTGLADKSMFARNDEPASGVKHEKCEYLGVAAKNTHYPPKQVQELVERARLEGYNTAMVWNGRSAYQAKSYDQIKGGWKDE